MPISDISTSPRDGSHVFDDFFANSGVADATVGTLNWELTAISTTSVITFVAGQNGILRDTTAITTGDGEAYTLEPNGVVLSGTNQEFWFRVRYPDVNSNTIAGNNFRIGFGDSVTATDSAAGIWVNSAAGVIELDVGSTNGDQNTAATGVSSLTSGTTMVLDTWHDFHVIMDGTNTNGGPDRVRLFVDGELAATLSNVLFGSAETVEFSMVHWNSTGATLELDIDYIEFWLPRN